MMRTGPRVRLERTEPNPEESVRTRQLRAFHRTLKDADLVAQARISSWSAARLPKPAGNEAISAVINGPKGIRMRRGNTHIIKEIRICENHSRFSNSISRDLDEAASSKSDHR